MSTPTPSPAYVMGHTDPERRRLALQASVLNPLTRTFLQRAGISGGMRVLDMGCGVGEVSRIAASLVGSHGYVTGIDIDPVALEVARARVREDGTSHVSFEHSSLLEYQPEHLYDAVIGRLILIHTPDPVEALRKAIALTHAGGVVAFQEYDLAHASPAAAILPLVARMGRLLIELFPKIVPHADIGLRLFALMQQAGLPPPVCTAECAVEGGPDSPVYEWFAETVRTMLPMLEKHGLATAADIDIDTLADRLRQESLERQAPILGPMLLGAFARKPSPE